MALGIRARFEICYVEEHYLVLLDGSLVEHLFRYVTQRQTHAEPARFLDHMRNEAHLEFEAEAVDGDDAHSLGGIDGHQYVAPCDGASIGPTSTKVEPLRP